MMTVLFPPRVAAEEPTWADGPVPRALRVVVWAVVDDETVATRGEAPPPQPPASSENAETSRTTNTTAAGDR
jgi:hypothetical protein